MAEEETLYTVQEAAGLLGVGETAIRNAMLDNRLPYEWKYGRKLIKQSDLDAYKQRTQPEGEKRIGRPPKQH